jgi:hypothetical protein
MVIQVNWWMNLVVSLGIPSSIFFNAYKVITRKKNLKRKEKEIKVLFINHMHAPLGWSWTQTLMVFLIFNY